MSRAHEILRLPVITEKSTFEKENFRTLTFKVARDANKQEIKEAVEKIFSVTVQDVRIINMAAHRRRHPRSRIMGHKAKQVVRKPGWKKAIVKLVEGQRLELFEGV